MDKYVLVMDIKPSIRPSIRPRPPNHFPSEQSNHIERKVRREIANSNERRRMQNINSGFDHLKELVCKESQDKISKAGVLRKTIDYLEALEEYNTLLIQQNRTLKNILAQSDKGEMANKFSSPVKRKLSEKNVRKATKCRKLNIDSDDPGVNESATRPKNIFMHQIYDLRSGLRREQQVREGNAEQEEVMLHKQEKTPSSVNEEAFPMKGACRSLDSIIEAINQLEGEERLRRSFEESQE